MKRETLFQIIGEADEEKVAAAGKALAEKQPVPWRRWAAAAACLCLVLAGLALVRPQRPGLPDSGGGIDEDIDEDIDGTVPGGALPEGMDPATASIAVFPAEESLAEVAEAGLHSLSREAAYGYEKLGAYLPAALPADYRFQSAGVYETTMQSGARYALLRASYTTEDAAPADTAEDEEDEMDYLEFSVFVMNFRPKTEKPIYTLETLPRDLGRETFHIARDDVYIGVEPGDLTYDELLEMLSGGE